MVELDVLEVVDVGVVVVEVEVGEGAVLVDEEDDVVDDVLDADVRDVVVVVEVGRGRR